MEPGVWSVPVPLHDSPIASVNLYALEHDDGLLLVDAGYDDDRCWAVVEAALEPIGGVAAITAIVLTHNHPDHVGLAGRAREASGAAVAIHRLDALAESDGAHGTFLSQLTTELALAGVPGLTAEEMVEASRRLARHSADLRADRFIAEGDVIGEGAVRLEVVETPGHTRGHVGLLDRERGLFFGGDLLLDGGELQLGLVATDDDDPARELEESLTRVQELPARLVLPGHWATISDPAVRAQRAIRELTARVTEAGEIVRARPGSTPWEIAARVEWGRAWETMGITARRFAVMQSIAWSRRLVSLGSARREPGSPERYFPLG